MKHGIMRNVLIGTVTVSHLHWVLCDWRGNVLAVSVLPWLHFLFVCLVCSTADLNEDPEERSRWAELRDGVASLVRWADCSCFVLLLNYQSISQMKYNTIPACIEGPESD